MLVSGLEYLDEPRELERLASLFNGGMGLGDHCGFFTASLMLIGLASAGIPDGRAIAAGFRKEFTDAWKARRPMLCREIKKKHAEEPGSGTCGDVGADAAAVLEKFLSRFAADTRRIRFARKSQ